MPDKVLKSIKPRKYQQEIYDNCKEKSCIVVLPTGIGKTLIGLMLSIYTQKKHPASKTLFLAPTRPLAEQHLEYFKKYLPELFAELTLFTGKTPAEKRKQLWQTADIIFSTPQCISNDLKNQLYDLEDVSLLVFDETHRARKNYAYTYIANIYKQQAKNPKVLGLTASPGADKKTIKEIAKAIGVESIEVRTRESDDVKEYLQELKFDLIKLDFPPELKEIQVLLKELHDKKIEELKNRKLLFQPATKKNILELQRKIMGRILSGDRHFNILAGVSACAQSIKLQYCLELLETQTLSSLQRYMQDLFKQAEQKKSKAVQQLIKNPIFNQAYIKTTELLAKKIENPKLQKLKQIIEQEFKEKIKNKKIIVFSQYRETITKICKTLNEIPNVRISEDVVTGRKWPEIKVGVLTEQESLKRFQDAVLALCQYMESSEEHKT